MKPALHRRLYGRGKRHRNGPSTTAINFWSVTPVLSILRHSPTQSPPPNFLYFFFLLLILSFSILFVFDPHRHVFQSAACRARSYQQRLIGCYLSSGYRISWSLFFGFAAPSSGREFAAATSVTVDLGTRRLGNRFTEWLGVWGGGRRFTGFHWHARGWVLFVWVFTHSWELEFKWHS